MAGTEATSVPVSKPDDGDNNNVEMPCLHAIAQVLNKHVQNEQMKEHRKMVSAIHRLFCKILVLEENDDGTTSGLTLQSWEKGLLCNLVAIYSGEQSASFLTKYIEIQ